MSLVSKLQVFSVYKKLGFIACIQVLLYRLRKKTKYYLKDIEQTKPVISNALSQLSPIKNMDAANYYYAPQLPIETFDWHKDGLSSEAIDSNQYWYKISWFGKKNIDIKNIWELSRFYWFAQWMYQARHNNNDTLIARLHALLCSWLAANPYGYGPNWMCGQECAIRLVNMLMGLELLQDPFDDVDMLQVIAQHCQRISLTRAYAKAQKNNHAISEAIGLYLGGLYLQKQNYNAAEAKKYMKQGQRLLTWCVQNLVLKDGTFAQYSTNYHRLALDLISICLLLAKLWGVEVPAKWLIAHQRMQNWLQYFVDPISGHGVNLGSNDGAMLLNFDVVDYQDYTYTLKMAAYIQSIYHGDNNIDNLFASFSSVNSAPNYLPQLNQYQHFTAGGLIYMSHQASWATLRYPAFKFRPHQCDLLHFDLWYKGMNVLCDSGTYSYHSTDELSGYFKSVAAHNSVQIDGLPQLRSLSRFLYLDWPKVEGLVCHKDSRGSLQWLQCCYQHYSGARHCRKIELIEQDWVITDTLAGVNEQIELYWHTPILDGKLHNNCYENDLVSLTIVSNCLELSVKLEECWVSRYYQTKEKASCITAVCHNITEVVIVTTICLK
jgi:hypothetical protein